jgi:hypothetical protein
MRFPMKRCAAHSKKQTQAVVEATVVHCPGGRRQSLAYGRCAGALHSERFAIE